MKAPLMAATLLQTTLMVMTTVIIIIPVQRTVRAMDAQRERTELRSHFILMSDLDDTIKISHSMDHFKTVLRGLFLYQAYAGMAELYSELVGENSSLVVLSSSPLWIRKKVQHFLRRNHFPKANIILRDWVKQPHVRTYKLEALQSMAREHTEPFILIGDDTEWDPEVFESFLNENPDRVLKIYIRRMRGRPLPEGMQGFHTAYEIALFEYEAGRLEIPQVLKVARAVAETKKSAHIIPYFAVCPEDLIPTPEGKDLLEFHKKIMDRLSHIARQRKLGKPA